MFLRLAAHHFLTSALVASAVLAPRAVSAQTAAAGAPAALTASDYARAERFMPYNATPLVLHTGVRATWLPDDRFWYRTMTEKGNAAVLIDPSTATRAACDLDPCRVEPPAAGRPTPPTLQIASPDGKQRVFIRDWNLWVRDVETGAEAALTTDGVKDFGYATDNAGWSTSERPIVVWSPDSTKVATFQQDQREVGDMYLVETRVGHPVLKAWKYPLPGDKVVSMIQRVVIDVAERKVIRLQMPPDQHRSTLCDDLACRGVWNDVQWSADGSTLAFASSSRDHKQVQLRVADAATGAVREVLEETVPTFFESGNGRVNWRYLPASNEVIWFSERDNWGHLYLYDLTDGG